MSTQIVAQVRDALFQKELHPGDFLGTEKDLAERFGVSRIVARDALRTLEAQGIVDIKVGAGGGARVAQGNARLFAEALAVQLDLAGVSRSARSWTRSAPSSASRPSLPPSTPRRTITHGCASSMPRPNASSTMLPAYTRLGREFHLAVAEASHNRVLVVQLISLQHVSWPAQNPTLTLEVAKRILAVHQELASLIEMRDPAGARRLMDDHVKMIGARRVAEHRGKDGMERECC